MRPLDLGSNPDARRCGVVLILLGALALWYGWPDWFPAIAVGVVLIVGGAILKGG